MTDWLQPLEPTGRPKRSARKVAVEHDAISFERAVERFAERHVSRRTGRPFSVTSRRNVLDNLLGAPLRAYRRDHGITTVDEWTGDHAAAYLRWLQEDMRRDSATVKKVRGQLRSFGEFCKEEFHVTAAGGGALSTLRVSPLSDFDRPKDPALTHAEAEALMQSAPTRRDRLAIALLLFTGMRPSEMLALERQRVRLDENPAVVEIRGSIHNDSVRNASRHRDVPLTIGQTMLPALLREHLADAPPAATSRLFLSKRGDASGEWKPLTLDGLRAMLFDLGASTGIKCNAHRLRHTFCTWCADAGMPMLHLQQLLGHATSDMVAPYYRGGTSRAVLDAAARVRF